MIKKIKGLIGQSEQIIIDELHQKVNEPTELELTSRNTHVEHTSGKGALYSITDGIDIDTSILIHSNNSEGDIIIEDSSSYSHQISINGVVTHTTSQSKIGTSSIAFSKNGSLRIPYSNEFALSGDFTIETYVRVNNVSGQAHIIASDPNIARRIVIYCDDTALRAGISPDAVSWGTWLTATITNDIWYHIAYVKSGNTFYLFVDGILQSTITEDISVYVASSDIYIGSWGDQYTLDGYIDELRISNIARYTSDFSPMIAQFTTNGIERLIYSNAEGHHDITSRRLSVTDDTITINDLHTLRVDPISGASITDDGNNTVTLVLPKAAVDTAVSEFNGVANTLILSGQENDPLSTETSGTLYVTSESGATIDAYTTYLLESNTTDGSTTFTDLSTINATLTPSGVTHKTNESRFGDSSLYLGGTDILSTDVHSEYSFETDDFMIDCWIKLDGDQGESRSIVRNHDFSIDKRHVTLLVNAQNLIWAAISIDGLTSTTINSTTTDLNDNLWHHIAFVRYGDTYTIYIDGKNESEQIQAGNLYNNPPNIIEIGSLTNSMIGWIDEVRISHGIARWTSDFIPPTMPYSYKATDLIYKDSEGNNIILSNPSSSLSITDGTSIIDNVSSINLIGASIIDEQNGDIQVAIDYNEGILSAYSLNIDDMISSPSVQDRNYRCVYPPEALNFTGSKFRLSLVSGDSMSLKINPMYIGYQSESGDPWDFESTPTQITFDGTDSILIPTGEIGISDWIDFNIDGVKNIIISMYIDDDDTYSQKWIGGIGLVTTFGKIDGVQTDTDELAPDGYSDYGIRGDIISSIEVLYVQAGQDVESNLSITDDTTTVINVSTLRVNPASGFSVDDDGNNQATLNLGSTFNPITIDGQDQLDATGEEELEIVAGDNITLTTDINSTPKSLTIASNITVGQYIGVWNANINSPDISVTTPNSGDWYKVSIAGTTNLDGETDWNIGDLLLYNGTSWDKIDNNQVPDLSEYLDKITYDTTDNGIVDKAEVLDDGTNSSTALEVREHIDDAELHTDTVFDGVLDTSLSLLSISEPELVNTYSKLYVSGGGVGNDDNTILLVHSSTTEGSIIFTDSSVGSETHTVNSYGNITHTTAEKKISTSSIYFDGVDDYLSIPNHSDLYFSNNDFTIDFWMRVETLSHAHMLLSKRESTTNQSWYLHLDNNGDISFNYSENGVTWSGTAAYTTGISINTWYHVSVVRNSTVLVLYINGNEIGTYNISITSLFNGTGPLYIGNYTGATVLYQGWIEELRISTSARWMTNFTPELSVYSQSNQSLYVKTDTGIVHNLLDRVLSGEKGAANGVVPLNASSQIDTQYLPTEALEGLEYQGVWNADTNAPDISSTTPNSGDWYKVSVSGSTDLDGEMDWNIGDLLLYNGTSWDKIDNTEKVHALDDTSLHTGVVGAIEDNLVAFDSNGLVKDSGKAISDIPDPFDGEIDTLVLIGQESAPIYEQTKGKLYTVGSGGDYDQYTEVLIHSNTIDGDLIFTDVASGHTVTPVGSIVHSITQAKFGTSSIDTRNGYLEMLYDAAWELGTDNFTIDFWIYPTSYPAAHYYIFGNGHFIIYSYSDGRIGCGITGQWETVSSAGGLTLNSWQHFAITRNINLFSVYKNGTLLNSITKTSSLENGSSNAAIGSDNVNTTDRFQGYIDEFRISKGITRWTTNFTSPTVPYEPFGITVNDIRFIDGQNNDTSLLNQTPDLSGYLDKTTYDTTDTGIVNKAESLNDGTYISTALEVREHIDDAELHTDTVFDGVLDGDLALLYTQSPLVSTQNYVKLYGYGEIAGDDSATKLLLHSNTTDGNTNIIDYSEFAHVDINPGVIHSTTQKYFGTSSLYFDGSNSYMTYASSPDFNLGSNDFTVDFWLYLQDVTTQLGIFQIGTSISDQNNFSLQTLNNGFRVQFGEHTQTILETNFSNTPYNNQWAHMAIVRNGDTLSVYTNGIFVTSANVFGYSAYQGIFYIGFLASTSLCFSGYIDEFRFVNGEAKWTDNFTPNTEAYGALEIVPQVKALFHDGTNVALATTDDIQEDTVESRLTWRQSGGPLQITTNMDGAKLTNRFGTIQSIYITCDNTGTTGSNLVIDILKNGTSIYTGGGTKPTIAANTGTFQYSISTDMDDDIVTATDVYVVAIESVPDDAEGLTCELIIN